MLSGKQIKLSYLHVFLSSLSSFLTLLSFYFFWVFSSSLFHSFLIQSVSLYSFIAVHLSFSSLLFSVFLFIYLNFHPLPFSASPSLIWLTPQYSHCVISFFSCNVESFSQRNVLLLCDFIHIIANSLFLRDDGFRYVRKCEVKDWGFVPLAFRKHLKNL